MPSFKLVNRLPLEPRSGIESHDGWKAILSQLLADVRVSLRWPAGGEALVHSLECPDMEGRSRSSRSLADSFSEGYGKFKASQASDTAR